jgi:molybdate transport system permease protein
MTQLWEASEIALRSFGVALLATVVVMAVSIPMAYLLARKDFKGKELVAALLMLPLVLPPTAVGLLLLVLLSPNGPLGIAGVKWGLLFTWRAAVVASAVMAFPLALRTARVAFDGVDSRLETMASSLGYSPWRRFATVTLPLASRGLLAAAVLAFLRGLGEYGATAMIAGNIPGQTQTLALAIEARHAAGRVGDALLFAGLAVALGLGSLVVAERLLAAPRTSRQTP